MPNVKLSLEGFRPLRKGETGYSQRRYINESTGEILSVRQYQKLAQRTILPPKPITTSKIPSPTKVTSKKTTAQPTIAFIKDKREGYTQTSKQTNTTFYVPISQKSIYALRLRQYTDNANRLARQAGLPEITLKQAMQSPEFKLYYKWSKSRDKSPTGKLAQALIAFGLRDPNADYDVGDTP